MHGVVVVAGGEDAIVGLGEDGGEGSEAGSLWPVEHLRLELGEFVLQVGKFVGQRLHDAGVDGPDGAVVGCPQILRACMWITEEKSCHKHFLRGLKMFDPNLVHYNTLLYLRT